MGYCSWEVGLWLWMAWGGVAVAGVASAQCYPLATTIEALVENATLDEPVFVEEWSTCAGDGEGGPSAVVLPAGDHGDTQGILEALVGAHNGSGGLDYDVRRVGPGWSVAPSDRPRCAETPIDPVEAGQHVLEVETLVKQQFRDHCGVRTAGRALGYQGLTMIEAPTTTEVLPAGTVLATMLAVLTEKPNDPVGWSLRLVTVDGREGVYAQAWWELPVQEPPVPDPFTDMEPLPPGVKGRLTDPDGRVHHVLDDGAIIEVRGPDAPAPISPP